jgi:hypothetical protein
MASCERRRGERRGEEEGERGEPVLSSVRREERGERREHSGSEITLACCCYLYELIPLASGCV